MVLDSAVDLSATPAGRSGATSGLLSSNSISFRRLHRRSRHAGSHSRGLPRSALQTLTRSLKAGLNAATPTTESPAGVFPAASNVPPRVAVRPRQRARLSERARTRPRTATERFSIRSPISTPDYSTTAPRQRYRRSDRRHQLRRRSDPRAFVSRVPGDLRPAQSEYSVLRAGTRGDTERLDLASPSPDQARPRATCARPPLPRHPILAWWTTQILLRPTPGRSISSAASRGSRLLTFDNTEHTSYAKGITASTTPSTLPSSTVDSGRGTRCKRHRLLGHARCKSGYPSRDRSRSPNYGTLRGSRGYPSRDRCPL